MPRYKGTRIVIAAVKKGILLQSLSETMGSMTAPKTPAITKTAPMIPASTEVIPRGRRMDSIQR